MNMTLLKALCECCGTSGRESAIRDLIRAELDRKGIPAEWIRTDRLGNLLVHIPGQNPAKRKHLPSGMLPLPFCRLQSVSLFSILP